jgi:hypothetical protein
MNTPGICLMLNEQSLPAQVVVVAAGYDTRAYRLAPRGDRVKFFEVDLPDASVRKAELAAKLRLVPDGVRLNPSTRCICMMVVLCAAPCDSNLHKPFT